MDDLVIQSHKGPYRVRFASAFTGIESGLTLREHLIIDARVGELYSEMLKPALGSHSVLKIEATEANKSIEKLPALITHLLERGIRRDHIIIAIGGGIIQDITAFMAATLFRGLPWKFYPTTLLAQADSCVGSKSSINVGGYKNQLGTFTPPNEVIISMELLDTLTKADVCSGIGEMIKAHIISGWDDTLAIMADYPKIFVDKKVMEHYIRHSLEIKKGKIETDEFDRNERLVMNYGHSFGHAIESATDYAIPHGIAVTLGMDLANYVSWRYDFIDQTVFDPLHRLLSANYRGFEKIPIPEDRFFAALTRDKKNLGGEITLILMRGPGQVFRGGYPRDQRLEGVCKEFLDSLPKQIRNGADGRPTQTPGNSSTNRPDAARDFRR